MNICSLKPGESAVVIALSAQKSVRRRLLDLGLMHKTKITVERFAPLGGPVWISLNGSQIALRLTEAESVTVEVFENEADLFSNLPKE